MPENFYGNVRKNQIRDLVLTIRDFQHSLKQLFRHYNQEMGFSQGQLFLLFLLSERGGMRISDISGHFGFTAGAATGFVDRLEMQGLLKRVRNQEDRRVVLVELTDAGKQRVEEIKENFMSSFEQVFSGVNEERLVELKKSMEWMTNLIRQHMEGRLGENHASDC